MIREIDKQPVILKPERPKDLARSFAQRSSPLGSLRMTSLFFAIYFFTIPAFAWTSEDAAQFQKANESYRSGKIDEAASVYRTLSEKHPGSSEIFYNLGNSLYRQGSVGEAILAYERARMIEPRNADIVYNLNYARSLLEYRIEDKRNWYLKAAEKILETLTEKEIYLLAIAAYFLLMASWAFVLFLRRGLPWGTWRKVFTILLFFFILIAVSKHVESRVMRDGVVVAKSAEVRYGPSEGDQIAFRLGEGLRLYVVERRSEWSRILLVNGETGWVSNEQIKEVRV
ncbi:MAG: tetratricopeptide repeat protein [Candidatus Omnitrophica bacterium]|nr:tetratricopeptide repeat protein [Candidatus Omnitrophota bacterium]